jgi:predicted RecA/RadA family phage recombinase
VAGTGKLCIGTIWEAAASAATTVKVKLHGGPLANFNV